jgi:hypothetical protein
MRRLSWLGSFALVACEGLGGNSTEGFDTDTGSDTELGSDTDTDIGTTVEPQLTSGGLEESGDPPELTTGGPAETTGGEPSACVGTGTAIVTLQDLLDQYGHFPYLMLFYAPTEPDERTTETFEVTVAPDGSITVELLPRAEGSGSGHAGLSGLTGTIDEDCNAELSGAIDFTSDTGPFGTVDVTLNGTWSSTEPTLDLTLEGGTIPNGPITYSLGAE